jgi:DNA-binding NarL/FixJ family response regulator
VTGDRPIRVLVVDDHAVVRRGVVAYLEALEDLEVAGEAGNGQETLDFLSRASAHRELPDVVLMDLQMPGMDGVTATGEVVRRFPEVRVVILTSFGETERVHAALEQGASGYLLKDAGPTEVDAALRAAVRDEVFLDAAVTRRLTQEMRTPRAGLGGLTAREKEVLVLVASASAPPGRTSATCSPRWGSPPGPRQPCWPSRRGWSSPADRATHHLSHPRCDGYDHRAGSTARSLRPPTFVASTPCTVS